jgi:hypothetical protein
LLQSVRVALMARQDSNSVTATWLVMPATHVFARFAILKGDGRQEFLRSAWQVESVRLAGDKRGYDGAVHYESQSPFPRAFGYS